MTQRAVTLTRTTDQWLTWGETQKGWTPETLRTYRWTMNITIDILGTETDPRTITEDDLLHCLATWKQRNPKLSTSSIANRISTWKSYFRWLTRKKYRGTPDPTLDIDRPRKRHAPQRTVTPKEFNALLRAAKTPNDQMLLQVLRWTGARRGEFLALTWGDIDFDEATILIRRGKGGKSRIIFIPVQLLSFLRSAKPADATDTTRLVTWQHHAAPGKTLIRLANRAGVKLPLSCHAFRRMYAHQYIEFNPAELHSLQAQMGHTSIDTTTLYTDKAPKKSIRAAVRRMSGEAELVDAIRDARQAEHDTEEAE